MEHLLALVEAKLSEKEVAVSNELTFLINTRIKPPVPVRKEEINIRAMYLVSDQVNSFGGCFPLDEHPGLAKLLIDSPVLAGHSKERLPIARNFKADLVKKDGVNWIKVFFYWLKNSPEANSLKENIDFGIYKECSLSLSFEFPECSICGEDMRRCQHVPFRTYQKENGEKALAYYNYRNIIKVHETSLVYRGAVFGTSITNELNIFQKHDCADGVCKFKRVYKESILESLKRAGLEDKVKLAGKMAEDGYSEDQIELLCERDLEEKVLDSLPPIFRRRIRFVSSENLENGRFRLRKFVLVNYPEKEGYELRFKNGEDLSGFFIHRLNLEGLKQGRRFLGDWIDSPEDQKPRGEVLDTGEFEVMNKSDNFFSFKTGGEILKEVYLMRKIILKNQEGWLFFRRRTTDEKERKCREGDRG